MTRRCPRRRFGSRLGWRRERAHRCDSRRRPRRSRSGDVGTDPIIRKTMCFSTTATTIVFGEHVILVLLHAAAAPARAARRRSRRLALHCCGRLRWSRRVGGRDDPLHRRADRPQRLHHAGRDPEGPAAGRRRRGSGHPRERPRPRFAWFLIPALVGFWLVNRPPVSYPSANGLVVIMRGDGRGGPLGVRHRPRPLSRAGRSSSSTSSRCASSSG